jgi:oxygen-dependent protoporphyrinogen oxidase
VKRVAVVGGGISGLAAAFALAEPEGRCEVSLLEAGGRVGGAIRSEERDGFRIEWAANGFLDGAAEMLRVVERLGLSSRLLPADAAAARRYIFRGGRLHRIPASPPAILGTSILSARGRLRLLAEPFVPRAAETGDESVYAFAARRLGDEAARFLVDPIVTGIFGGDARALSLRSAFPVLHKMEATHGSLLRAALAGGRPRRPRARLVSFAAGMEELPRAFASRLGPRVRTGARVVSVESGDGVGESSRWLIRLEGGDPLACDGLLLACAPQDAAGIVSGFDAGLAALLERIPRAPIAVVALGYRLADLAPAPDGFGFLVPKGEGLRPLGALFDSNIYPDRAPSGHLLARVLFGGARDPDAVALEDGPLVREAREALGRACAVTAEPRLAHVIRHRGGIPQYVAGHAELLGRIEQRLGAHPALYFAGNGYSGVAVSACVAEGTRVAAALLGGEPPRLGASSS